MSTLVSPRNVEPMRGEPPGPKGVPYFGCVGEMRRNPMRFFTKVAQTYGGIARIPLMTGSHVYLVSEPALLHELLVANRDKYMKNVRYRQAQDLVGLGLLLSEGDSWKRQRLSAQPGFNPGTSITRSAGWPRPPSVFLRDGRPALTRVRRSTWSRISSGWRSFSRGR